MVNEAIEVVTHGIGWAVKQLQDNQRVTRDGWNGKNMFLELVRAHEWESDVCLDGERQPFIAMFTAQSMWVPWLASQSDLLAMDWKFA